MIDRIQLATSDGETLEARWDSPGDRGGGMAIVFCHPHPMHGGTMMAPLMISVSTRLRERGFSVLRFNFRGAGKSTGKHDFGRAELIDIDAAMTEAHERASDLGIAGWSFGGATALNWLASRSRTIPYVGIAPPAHNLPGDLPAGPKRLIAGTRDQVINVAALRRYAESQSIDLLLTPGDHFFHGRGRRIGDFVAQGFES